MFKKLFYDPSFLFLLAANIFCLWYYSTHKDGFATIVWIYWFQSVIIGLFTFLDLLTIKKFSADGFKLNDQPVTEKNQGCAAWFFLVHYGFFHFGYMIFLFVQLGVSTVNTNILMLVIGGLLIEGIMSFRKRKELEKTQSFSIGTLFFLPYLRVVPMHLMILGPVFLGWQASSIFLVLKMLADILSYFAYLRIYGQQINE